MLTVQFFADKQFLLPCSVNAGLNAEIMTHVQPYLSLLMHGLLWSVKCF